MNERKKINPLSAILILVVIVFASLWLYRAVQQIESTEREIETIQGKLAEVKSANEALREQIANSDDAKVRENIARQRLGLILPGEIVYKES